MVGTVAARIMRVEPETTNPGGVSPNTGTLPHSLFLASSELKVNAVLEAKVRSKKDEDFDECEEEVRGGSSTMDADIDDADVNESANGEDNEEGSEEVKALNVHDSPPVVGVCSNGCKHGGDICDPCLSPLNDYPLSSRRSARNGIHGDLPHPLRR